MKNLRKAVAAALVLILALSLAACQANPAANNNANASTDYEYIYTSEIGTLNYLVTNKTVDAEAIAAFVDPLILVNKFGGFEPGMATKWEQSDDGLTWTLEIRKDIKWQKSDGSEYGPNITAQDWVDAIEYILDPEMASFTVDMVTGFIAGADEYYTAKAEGGSPDFSTVGVKATGEYTLEYTTADVCPFFPSLLTYSCYLPINKQFVEEIGGIANFGTTKDNFLYYGEYLFKEWIKDQKWHFTKNDKYYLANRVHVNNRTYVMVQDPKVTLEMYKRGEITASPVSADQYDGVLADPELGQYVFRTSLGSATWYYHFNHASPFENTRLAAENTNFRKAVFASINRTTLLQVSIKTDPEYLKRNTLNIWGLSIDENGKDYMSYGRLPQIEADDNYKPETVPAFIEQAKAELGATVTWPVVISLAVQNTDSSIQVAEITKQNIEEASGGQILVEFLPFAAEDYYAVQEEGNFDLTSAGWSPDFADPSSYLEINQTDGYIGSRCGFASVPEWVEFDRMMREAKALTILSERYAALAEAEAYMIEHALTMPYRANGGNFSINNMQNPYDSLSRIPYGLCNAKWLDVRYGEKPLTVEEREVQRAAYEKERDAK